MDDAKRPAPETVNFSSCRIVSVRAVPAASPNFAPVYCLMTSEVDGFPIQQAIPLIPLGGAVQGADDVRMAGERRELQELFGDFGLAVAVRGQGPLHAGNHTGRLRTEFARHDLHYAPYRLDGPLRFADGRGNCGVHHGFRGQGSQ